MNNDRFKGGDRKGRREIWLERVRPRLVEIEDLYANGATIQQIEEAVGVSGHVLLDLRRSEPELAEAFKRAHERRKETLENEVWRLARGEVVSVEEIEIRDKNGELKGTQKKVLRPVPYLPAALAYLKQNYGWADNPKVDDAVANALSGEDWTAKISLIPGFSDLRPKSSEADNFGGASIITPGGDGGAVDPKPAPGGQALPLVRGYEAPVGRADGENIAEGLGPDDADSAASDDEGENFKEGDDDGLGE